MRTGPRPLMTHLGLALSSNALKGKDFAASEEELAAMMRGIRKYQMHPFVRTMEPLDEIWEAGQAKLLHCPCMQVNKMGAVFILPSMVNRTTILDIAEEQSFVRWLAGQGFDVFMLDWGEAVQDEGQADMDVLFETRIKPALSHAAEQSGMPLHLIGYCMGGTMAAAAAQLYKDYCASLTLLAAPWDFHAGDETLTKWVQFWAPTGLASIVQYGYLPSDWIQTVFASLDPFQTAEKFKAFADMQDDDPKEEIFIAVEDWLNDPVHLPGALAQTCIQDWFTDNKTIEGRWRVCGQGIAPEQIDVPMQVVASVNDRLVPYDAALAFADGMDNIHHVRASCGHIGFMASGKAPKDVWAPLLTFIKTHKDICDF